MMDIRILGSGCPKCKEVEKRVIDVLSEMNIAADVQKVTDLKQIMEYKIMATPGLVINGKIKSAGKIPSRDEIGKWVEEEKE
jgi:small redox-active disulfide protein 2